MKIASLYRPKDVEDALKVSRESTDTVVFGGGAWLKLSPRLVKRAVLLDDMDLATIETSDDAIRVGAMCTLRMVETHDAIAAIGSGIIVQALRQVMGVGLRNIATVGGSVMGKYGFSDVLPPLLALYAKLMFADAGEVSLASFMASKKRMNDIMLYVTIPRTKSVGFFKKVSTTSLDFSLLNITVCKTRDRVRVVLGSRPGGAMHQDVTSRLDLNTIPDEKTLDDVVREVLDAIPLGQNVRASKFYREQLAKTYVRRGVKEVMSREG